jgi:hypothetical protein
MSNAAIQLQIFVSDLHLELLKPSRESKCNGLATNYQSETVQEVVRLLDSESVFQISK